MYTMYINDLATASKFAASLFADDTSLLMKHKNLVQLEQLCNTELVHINNWFLANRLTANMSKASKYMLTLGKSRMKHPECFVLKMGDTVLEKVNSIKYLGVIFDEKFKWEGHISYISSKISCSVGILSKLRYYVNTETLIKVYQSLVCSHLSYALYFDNYFRSTQVTHRYNLRHNADGSLCPIDCNKASMEKSIRYYGPIVWEKLTFNLKTLSFSKFKKEISNKLFTEYY